MRYSNPFIILRVLASPHDLVCCLSCISCSLVAALRDNRRADVLTQGQLLFEFGAG